MALLVAANNVITGYYAGNAALYPGGISPHMLDLIGSLVLGLVILAVRQLWASKNGNSLLTNFAAWTCAVLASFGVQALLIFASNNAFDSRPLLYSFLTGFPQAVALCGLFTILLASWVGSHNTAKALAVQNLRLAELRKTMDLRVAFLENQLSEIVDGKLAGYFHGLQIGLRELAPTAASNAAKLVLETLESKIRPLSWDIHSAPVRQLPLAKPRMQKVPLLKRLGYLTNLEQAFSPTLFVVVTAIYNLPFSYYVFGLNGLWQQTAAIVLAFVIFKFVSRRWGSTQLPSWLSALLFALLGGFSGLLFVFLQVSNPSAGELDFSIPLSMAQTALIIGIFSTISTRRLDDIENARRTNAELNAAMTKLRQTAWAKRKRLANLVHGSVQGNLLRVYFELINRSGEFAEIDAENLSHELARISQPSDDGSGNPSGDFRAIVSALCTTWLPEKPIRLELAEHAWVALVKDDVAAECTIDVLQDGLNNAIKYGDPGEIKVSIDRTNEGIELIVSNFATPREQSNKLGYGTQNLNDLASKWSFALEDNLAVLRATIPLSEG